MTIQISILRRHCAAAAALLALPLLLSSCVRDAKVVATVGSRTITAEEYLDFARNAQAQYSFMPDSAKHVLLDDLIRRSLMLEEARARGFMKDAAYLDLRKGAEEELLLNEISGLLSPRSVPISDAELATFYEWRRTEHKLEGISAPDEAQARQALSMLREGQPFSVVAQRFNVMGVAPPNGDLGFIPGGALPEPLDTRVRRARIGELIGPQQVTPEAWFIMRVVERRTTELPPFDAIRDQLLQQLSQRKRRDILNRSISALRAEYRIQISPGGAQEMFSRANHMYDSAGAEGPADDQIVLATYAGLKGDVKFTMADALQELDAMGDAPNYSSTAALTRWIESHVMRRVVLDAGRRRHLNEEPALVRDLDRRLDGSLLQRIYNDEISGKVTVSDADVEAEYLRRAGPQGAPIDQMPVEFRNQLQTLVLELKRDAVFRAFTDDLRKKYPVTVNAKLFESLPWPKPPEAPGMPMMQIPSQG